MDVRIIRACRRAPRKLAGASPPLASHTPTSTVTFCFEQRPPIALDRLCRVLEEPPYLTVVADLLRKVDEACKAAATLREKIGGQMRDASARDQIADDDTAVVAARTAKS